MAYNTKITAAVANAACNAVVDSLDTGGAGTVRIYDGTQPATADTAITTQNVLAEFTLSATAFGNASDGVATCASMPKTDTSANNTGTATWFRAVNGSGTTIIDGSVGTSGCDMNIDNTSIVTGQTVNLTAWTVTMPKS